VALVSDEQRPEDAEMLFRGERGEKGQQGQRGQQGDKGDDGPALPRRKAWAVVYLFGLAVLLSVLALFWINHEAHVTEAAVQHQAQVQAQAQQRQQLAEQAAQHAAQLKQSRAICGTLVGLDDASHGAQFASASHTGIPLSKSYGYRLAHAIHAVVDATHCRALLAGKLPRT
jgi:hypothetical protein